MAGNDRAPGARSRGEVAGASCASLRPPEPAVLPREHELSSSGRLHARRHSARSAASGGRSRTDRLFPVFVSFTSPSATARSTSTVRSPTSPQQSARASPGRKPAYAKTERAFVASPAAGGTSGESPRPSRAGSASPSGRVSARLADRRRRIRRDSAPNDCPLEHPLEKRERLQDRGLADPLRRSSAWKLSIMAGVNRRSSNPPSRGSTYRSQSDAYMMSVLRARFGSAYVSTTRAPIPRASRGRLLTMPNSPSSIAPTDLGVGSLGVALVVEGAGPALASLTPPHAPDRLSVLEQAPLDAHRALLLR